MTLLGEILNNKRRFVLSNIDSIRVIYRTVGYNTFKQYYIGNTNVTSQLFTLKRRKLIKLYPVLHLTAEY